MQLAKVSDPRLLRDILVGKKGHAIYKLLHIPKQLQTPEFASSTLTLDMWKESAEIYLQWYDYLLQHYPLSKLVMAVNKKKAKAGQLTQCDIDRTVTELQKLNRKKTTRRSLKKCVATAVILVEEAPKPQSKPRPSFSRISSASKSNLVNGNQCKKSVRRVKASNTNNIKTPDTIKSRFRGSSDFETGTVSFSDYHRLKFLRGRVQLMYKGNRYVFEIERSSPSFEHIKQVFISNEIKYNVLFNKSDQPEGLIFPEGFFDHATNVVKKTTYDFDTELFFSRSKSILGRNAFRVARLPKVKNNRYLTMLCKHHYSVQQIFYQRESDNYFNRNDADYSFVFTVKNSANRYLIVWESTLINTATYCFECDSITHHKRTFEALCQFLNNDRLQNKRQMLQYKSQQVVDLIGDPIQVRHNYEVENDDHWFEKMFGLFDIAVSNVA